MLIQVFQELVAGRIQHLKQVPQPLGQIAPIGGGALFDQVLELAALENAGVLGEQAEQQADQIDFQLMARVTDGLELVVQLAHAFGGLDVDRVLLFIGRSLIPGDEAEQPHVFVEIL